jgi:hypothetical protein
MAIVSWHVFAQSLTTSMVAAPVSYATFWVIFMYREPSIVSLYRLLRDIGPYRVLTSMAFTFATVVFLLGFPTFASAMTGYVSKDRAYVIDTSGNLVKFLDYEFVAYVIHDGQRVNGLWADYPVPFSGSKSEPREGMSLPFLGVANLQVY